MVVVETEGEESNAMATPRTPLKHSTSFATELLGAFETVKKKNQRSVKLCEDLVGMIRHRASAEEDYAKSLQRVAALSDSLSVDEEEPGCESTFMEGLSALRADLLKKSTQHNLLAHQLLTEVLEPVAQFKNQFVTQSKDLNDRAAQLAKTAKGLDQKYRSSHVKFEKAYQTAAVSCSQIIDLGGTPPKAPDAQLLYKKYGLDKLTRQSSSNSSATNSGTKGKEEPSRLKSLTAGTANIITQVARTDLTSWLLPTEKERLKELMATATENLELAELCRFSCRENYEALTVYAKEATHHLQLMLAEYQMLEERCADEIKVVMRKQVVFESSSLANQQYDLQMIFKLLESIDHDQDLHGFIQAHRTEFPGMDIENILSNLCVNPAPLPVPPPGLLPEQPVEDPTVTHPEFPIVRPGEIFLLDDSSTSTSGSSSNSDSSSSSPSTGAAEPRVAPASSVLRMLIVSRAPSPTATTTTPCTGDADIAKATCCSDMSPAPAAATGEEEDVEEEAGKSSTDKVDGASEASANAAAANVRPSASPVPIESPDGAVEWSI